MRETGRVHDAIAVLREAVQVAPYHAEAHYRLGCALLARGEYAEGFAEHEWRWRWPGYLTPRRYQRRPLWRGDHLEGRTILVHPEQGYGDSIQFVRFVRLVSSLGGRVVLESPPPLLHLFRGIRHVDAVVAQGQPPPPFDVQAPLMSLPHLLGTTLETLPNETPYLSAPLDRLERMASHVCPSRRLRVGLVWAGNPAHPRDASRSLSLSALAPLAGLPETSFYSLQMGPRAAEAAAPPAGMVLHDLSSVLRHFADTAAALTHLDLVIAVDTSVAHLAGALGRPTWLLLPSIADWRWLDGREDSPWYPSFRLFRQRAPGGWDDVAYRVASALRADAASVEP